MSRLILLPLLLLAGAPALAGDVEADRAAVRQVFADLETANNQGDVDAWVALFEDGAVYMPSQAPTVTTREGLRDIAKLGFGVFSAAIEIEPVEVTLHDDWAVARATVGGTVVAAQGEQPITIDNRELAVLHRQPDGTWKLARLMINKAGL